MLRFMLVEQYLKGEEISDNVELAATIVDGHIPSLSMVLRISKQLVHKL